MTSPPYPPPRAVEDVVLVEILNTNLVSLGMIQWATINATLYYNAVGSWTVLAMYSDWLWNQIMAGEFIVKVTWRGLFSFGGKCEQPTYSSSIPGSTGAGAGAAGATAGRFITLNGGDYLQILANRICYPDPTVAWTSQVPASADLFSGPLETAIKYYVNRNAGSTTIMSSDGKTTIPPAITSRRHPLLTVANDQGRGPTVNYAVKFGANVNLNLMDVVRSLISQNSTKMGVQITQSGSGLVFDVYIPQDKSSTISFSEGLGNLTSVNFSLTDPTVTDVLVIGAYPMRDTAGNPTADPSFVQQTAGTVTPWNKAEKYVDDSNETLIRNLKADAANVLFEGTMGAHLATTTTESPYIVYGRDYHVGDIVSVEVLPGDIYTDVIASVTLTCDPTQTPIMNAVPAIGNYTDPFANDKTMYGILLNKIKGLEKKLAAKGR